MNIDPSSSDFEGLRSAFERAFPKRCRACGREYPSLEYFLTETKDPPESKSLSDLEGFDLDKVALWRNCPCGSTLMVVCNNRRDLSAEGQRRRDEFERRLADLGNQLPAADARRHLLEEFRKAEAEDW